MGFGLRARSLEHFGPTLHFEGIWTSGSNIQLSGKRASKRARQRGRAQLAAIGNGKCTWWTAAGFGESIPDYLALVSIAY